MFLQFGNGFEWKILFHRKIRTLNRKHELQIRIMKNEIDPEKKKTQFFHTLSHTNDIKMCAISSGMGTEYQKMNEPFTNSFDV